MMTWSFFAGVVRIDRLTNELINLGGLNLCRGRTANISVEGCEG